MRRRKAASRRVESSCQSQVCEKVTMSICSEFARVCIRIFVFMFSSVGVHMSIYHAWVYAMDTRMCVMTYRHNLWVTTDWHSNWCDLAFLRSAIRLWRVEAFGLRIEKEISSRPFCHVVASTWFSVPWETVQKRTMLLPSTNSSSSDTGLLYWSFRIEKNNFLPFSQSYSYQMLDYLF